VATQTRTKKARWSGPARTRERILSAAERLFAERGFDRASMPEIARLGGITAGASYKHFDSKDDLFFEVVRRAVDNADIASTDLPRIVSAYTLLRLTLLHRLAVEIHRASAEDAGVDLPPLLPRRT
jgi:AcrR family transcriptional regulator